jgi:hypothetical protein
VADDDGKSPSPELSGDPKAPQVRVSAAKDHKPSRPDQTDFDWQKYSLHQDAAAIQKMHDAGIPVGDIFRKEAELANESIDAKIRRYKAAERTSAEWKEFAIAQDSASLEKMRKTGKSEQEIRLREEQLRREPLEEKLQRHRNKIEGARASKQNRDYLDSFKGRGPQADAPTSQPGLSSPLTRSKDTDTPREPGPEKENTDVRVRSRAKMGEMRRDFGFKEAARQTTGRNNGSGRGR